MAALLEFLQRNFKKSSQLLGSFSVQSSAQFEVHETNLSSSCYTSAPHHASQSSLFHRSPKAVQCKTPPTLSSEYQFTGIGQFRAGGSVKGDIPRAPIRQPNSRFHVQLYRVVPFNYSPVPLPCSPPGTYVPRACNFNSGPREIAAGID